MKEGYSVTVSKWGKPILTIELNMLSGAELSDEDTTAVYIAGQSLCGFSGAPKEECYINGIRHNPTKICTLEDGCDCDLCIPF